MVKTDLFTFVGEYDAPAVAADARIFVESVATSLHDALAPPTS